MNVIRGDILMPLGTRNAMTDKRALWPGGVIPYFVTSGMSKYVELWISGLSARSGTREVPGSSPVSSYSCEDNFSQLNP